MENRSTISKKQKGALALFIAVYIATLVLLILPKDMIRPAPQYQPELTQN